MQVRPPAQWHHPRNTYECKGTNHHLHLVALVAGAAVLAVRHATEAAKSVRDCRRRLLGCGD
eukprot:4981542-Pyramimonas_sp.AAC.1